MKQGCITITSIFMSGLLTACGGGGGGSDPDPVIQPGPDTQYTGLTTDASITPESASAFIELLLSESDIDNPLDALSSPSANAKATFNEPMPCEMGSGIMSGTLDDETYVGTIKVVFEQCYSDDIAMNGEMEMKIETVDQFNIEPVDYTLTFNPLMVTDSDGESVVMSGSTVVRGDGTCDSSETQNLVLNSSVAGESYFFDNLRISERCDYSMALPYETVRQELSGDIYLADRGKITLASSDVIMALDVYGFDAPGGAMDLLASGEVTISNSTGALSFTGLFGDETLPDPTVFYVQVKLDQGLDGQSEVDAIVPAWWLNVPGMMDMEDSDGDGMWRGWELAHGLDPTVADGELDSDNDGFTNLQEFVAHTHPMNQSDFPAEEE
ncbi:hypothetical protein DU002_06080 [Corallincola holothuriorum]|uniref:Lipoprotein n=1 Tax=Corallincola holothuriorum TaxID=2282215 RepID=A0A368NJW7_9GAMM|nr:hypothetical protein [Corallincola holothuriorum]RCU50892.1 hypothetical protein DU002_06080 [Corallincola holothuriorum]